MAPEPTPGPAETSDVLNDAFEAALRGDGEALGVLLSLLKTRYGKLIFKRLRVHRRGAHTATLDDIFQQSLVEFIERVKSASFSELPDAECRNVVAYFQDLCDRKLANLKRARLDPVNAAAKRKIPFDLAQDQRLRNEPGAPGDVNKKEEQRQLISRAIDRLDPFDRQVIERYLAGNTYAEISWETGKKISTLESLVTRIKQELAETIAQESQTAMIQLTRKKDLGRKKSYVPTAQEILSAIEDLPIEAQNAIEFVHVKGGSVADLARSLGDPGEKMARAQLARGYESLSVALGVPFPDSFELLKK